MLSIQETKLRRICWSLLLAAWSYLSSISFYYHWLLLYMIESRGAFHSNRNCILERRFFPAGVSEFFTSLLCSERIFFLIAIHLSIPLLVLLVMFWKTHQTNSSATFCKIYHSTNMMLRCGSCVAVGTTPLLLVVVVQTAVGTTRVLLGCFSFSSPHRLLLSVSWFFPRF